LAEGKDWFLTLGSGIKGKGGAVLLYRSPDLRHWTYLHPLIEGHGTGRSTTNPVDNGEMWECPDFFPLGDRHVLVYAAMGKVFWKTGWYHDYRFTAEKDGVVDFGAYYAPKTMLDEKGNRVLWGWIPETRPEADYRAAGWAGLMALPRTLSIGADGGLEMSFTPAVEGLRSDHIQIAGSDLTRKAAQLAAIRIHNLAAEMKVEFMAGSAFVLRLRSEKDEAFAEVAYDPESVHDQFRVNSTSALLRTTEPLSLHLLLDGSCLEVLVNRTTVITARIYKGPSSPLKLEVSDLGGLKSLHVWQMKPISKDRLTT
jgi:beta-fructofuranosidase